MGFVELEFAKWYSSQDTLNQSHRSEMLISKTTRNRSLPWSTLHHCLHTKKDKWIGEYFRGFQGLWKTSKEDQNSKYHKEDRSPFQAKSLNHPPNRKSTTFLLPNCRMAQPRRISHNPVSHICLHLHGGSCMMGNSKLSDLPVRTEHQPIRTALAYMAGITPTKNCSHCASSLWLIAIGKWFSCYFTE